MITPSRNLLYRTVCFLSVVVAVFFLATRSGEAANFSSPRHGFELNLENWSVDREGEKSNYAFGQATNSNGQYRVWFILSRVNKKENDEDWQNRQLVEKSVPNFSKNHNGHCDIDQASQRPITLGAATGKAHHINLSCRDGHKTQAAYLIYRSPQDSHRGFVFIYPNANQKTFDNRFIDDFINGWRWTK